MSVTWSGTTSSRAIEYSGAGSYHLARDLDIIGHAHRVELADCGAGEASKLVVRTLASAAANRRIANGEKGCSQVQKGCGCDKKAGRGQDKDGRRRDWRCTDLDSQQVCALEPALAEFHDAGPTAVLLHHPTAPYPDDPLIITGTIANAETDIQKLALDYLRQVKDLTQFDFRPRLPDEWLDQLALEPVQDRTFTWLPIRWPSDDTNFGDPFVSFRVARGRDSNPADEAVILLASEWRPPSASNKTGYLGSEFGLRIVATVRSATGGKRSCASSA